MTACPECGTELPDGSRFCLQCGASLAAPSARPEERKIVTTLFCDLVGSTAMGAFADPEDVDALLKRYNDMAQRVVESHGGTVEKFIGDAVVAVFGVPHVHEDDAERAVRAGLRIAEEAERVPGLGGEPLKVRVGVDTGEALVRLDVAPGSGGTFLTGDAVNTAARLQGVAPPMGVVVGRTTHDLTAKAIVYEELEPTRVKGKNEPLAVWRALQPVARTGATTATGATPFVGRQVELSYLTALLDKAAASASPQVALIVGEPGIGKSRLVAEIFTHAESGDRLITWRQGACLPYGEGVTFWALAEIVKAHAGILDTDGRETVEGRLEDVLPDGEDLAWFRQRLRALLGLEAVQAERGENFTAWLRFLEDIAARSPTVLVIEDLHWADDALLAFVEHFAANVADVPLFLIATARPELFERFPAFGATGKINRIVLEPLSEAETETLVTSLLKEREDEVRRAIARRAAGNPFYAEESSRLVRDQVAPSAVPGSIQAVIAARLDALSPELKVMLADASVVGEVFSDGALAAVGERAADEVDGALGELVARQLVRRVRTTSMAGEREFAFGHALARDVAYNELPRAARARKHAAVAGWIEQKAGDRAEDLAEILAHHYATALELARAAGEDVHAKDLIEPAVRYLQLAGDRAAPLNVAAAERYFARALDAGGPDSPRHATLLVEWSHTAAQLGRQAETIEALTEAVARLPAEGDVRSAAVAQIRLAAALPDDGRSGWLKRADDAVASLETDGPSPELVITLREWLKLTIELGDFEKQLAAAERGLELCEQLDLPVIERMELLVSRGCARCDLGLTGGDEDLRLALEMCRASGLGEHTSWVFTGVANWIYIYEGFRASLDLVAEGLDAARRRGAVDLETDLRAVTLWASHGTGDWDQVLDQAEWLDPLFRGSQSSWILSNMRATKMLVLAERGLLPDSADSLEWLEQKALEESTSKVAVYAAAAAARAALGDTAGTLVHLLQTEAALKSRGAYWEAHLLPHVVRMALVVGDRELAERLARGLEGPLQPLVKHALVAATALVAEACGDFEAAAAGFADAAARWHDFAAVYEEAHALFGRGRCLVALGRAPEAAPVLEEARAIFARLGAKPALEETEALIAGARP